MIRDLAALPTHLRKRLAQALDSGRLVPPYSPVSLQSVLGSADEKILAALRELADMGIAGRAAANWLRALDAAMEPVGRPDLVWSGPEVEGVPARDTRRVYEELFSSARRSLWAVSYAYFDGPRVFDLLAKRMEAVPELRVTLLLNIDRGHLDTSSPDEVVRRFANRFWKKDWPGKVRPAVFYDPRSVDPDTPGVLHAKAVVADDKRVFVTSANFTGAALDHNIELGLLLRDRPLALSVAKHLQGLIDHKLLRALPTD
ncbi:DISARM system phospholipase D-like protein DrmC [Candidatus Palauibacter sp.]|uniref:DISARM system phospholipase D-like protein DrmC n=1 Tax=Candidatus Palauibacter sp. TaxID=3101350 RepID=UPI003AF20728